MVKRLSVVFFSLFFLVFTSIESASSEPLNQNPSSAGVLEPYNLEIPILAYHKIDQTAPSKWYVTAEQFARQMDVLQAYGYQTVSLSDFMNYRDGQGTPPEHPIIITFDDGFQGVYQYLRPILNARNMDATFFIITGKVADNDQNRIDNSWQNNEPLAYHLIWPEVAQMFQDGFKIESHTVSHPSLPGLSTDDAQVEISQSRANIQGQLPGNPVDFFAYPYGAGAHDDRIRGLVQQAGYQAAVGFVNKDYPDDDKIANPATSDLWALPRRAIYNDITLELNPQNPWPFFMRRVDPDFPIPNITIHSLTVRDSWGMARNQFYPGEAITVSVKVSNWLSPTNVIGSLDLQNRITTTFQSHNLNKDVSISPLHYGSGTGTFSYAWVTPQVTAQEPYSYSLRVRDPTYLLGYFTSGWYPAFTVQPSLISVRANYQSLLLAPGEQKDLIFTVNTTAPAEEMYLVVSFSNGITVTQASPANVWTEYPIGSPVKLRTCPSPCVPSSFLRYEAHQATYGSGTNIYSLTIGLVPGAVGEQWIKYRLTMRVPGQGSPYWYLRDPLGGEVDQQDYYAFFLPVNPNSKIYFPVIFR